MNKVNNFCQSGKNPGENIKEEKRLNGSKVGKNCINPENSKEAGTNKNNKGWNTSFAKSPVSGNCIIHKSSNRIRKPHYRKSHHSGLNNSGVTGK